MAGYVDRVLKILDKDATAKRDAIRAKHEPIIMKVDAARNEIRDNLVKAIHDSIVKALAPFHAILTAGHTLVEFDSDRGYRPVSMLTKDHPALAKAEAHCSSCANQRTAELSAFDAKVELIRRKIILHGVDDEVLRMLAEL